MKDATEKTKYVKDVNEQKEKDFREGQRLRT